MLPETSSITMSRIGCGVLSNWVIGCTLPWSVFLLVLLSREFWRRFDPKKASGVGDDPGPRQLVMFLLVCLAITFPSCWLIPGAHGRYFMPLYPCIAPLVGLVVEYCLLANPISRPRRIWQAILTGMGVVIVGLALAMVSAGWLGFPKVSLLIQERYFSLIYAAGALAFVGVLWRLSGRSHWRWGFASRP